MTPLELQAIRDRLSYSQKVRKDLPHKVTVTYNACVLSDIAALLAEVERLNRMVDKMKSEACPPILCMDGIKCSDCWENWLTTVCDEMRELEEQHG